ncbi:collagen alpha-3(VI) chain-like [Echeneis naucrates]|uniref:collagen alpha-3(VI) chain-like n=1 Tax=Echeneis naucrates TaxID=173247 RepID=UPI001113AC7E|nr:collagen alpha-3(VI) chain-like [Echeneis naucrates]
MKSFVQRLVETLSIGENKDRVSVVQYSRDPKTHFYLNTYMEKRDILNALQEINHKGGGPRNTGAALDYVRHNTFTDSSGSRYQEGIPQILILLSGGRSQDDVASAAVALKQHKVVPLCVGTRKADILELQMIAHNPSYAFTVPRFDDIGSIYQQLVSFVKRVPRQQPRLKPENILDESQSEFQALLGFVKRMVENLSVDERNDHISVVQYSREPSAEFFLNTHKTRQSVMDNMQSLRHKGGRLRNTGAALQYVKDNVFTASSGSRHQRGVPQILVLLTGGRSSDDVRNAVESLKGMGVMVFVVGTKNADALEIQSVSQEPTHAFLVTDSSDLSDIEQQILSAIRSETPAIKPISYDARRRDVVFLLDGSDDSQESFLYIKDFVQRMVTELKIGTNNDRMAVVQYSNTAETNFDLRRYSTEDDVLDAVRGLSHKGGYPHNAGAALQYVKDHIFTSESGSRLHEGVPQILIVLSGGRSEDDIRTPVRMLKENGSSSNVNRDIVFLIDGSDDVRSRFSSIREFVAKLVEGFDLDKGKDKVAVVQYSNNAELNFNLNTYNTRNDVLKHVASLKPKGGRPQYIGAALQFVKDKVFVSNAGSRHHEGAKQILVMLAGGRSRDSPRGPAKDVLTAVRRLSHKGGRPLKIGAALQYVKDNIFTVPTGSRHTENLL